MSKGARIMPTPEKVQAVADIRDRLEGAEAVFLTEYRGLTVKAVQELRRSLRASGADYKVVKMTLTKLAAEEAGFDGMADFLSGPTAVAFAQERSCRHGKGSEGFLQDARRVRRQGWIPLREHSYSGRDLQARRHSAP